MTPNAHDSAIDCMRCSFVASAPDVDALTKAGGKNEGGAEAAAGALTCTGVASETARRSISGGPAGPASGTPVLAKGGGGPAGGLPAVGAPGSSKWVNKNDARACSPGVVGVRGTAVLKAADRRLSRKAGKPNRSA